MHENVYFLELQKFSQQLLCIFEITVYYRGFLVLIFEALIGRQCKGNVKAIRIGSSKTLKLLEIIYNPGTVM